MKTKRILINLLSLFVATVFQTQSRAGDNLVDAMELVRTTYKTDRQALVAQEMHFTESESAAFWPLYRSYRADMDKIGDELVKLVLEYADVYPNVTEEKAASLLKQSAALEKKLLEKRQWYLKRVGKFLPAAKVLRWAQLESRMDLGLRLQLANAVPLVPTGAQKQ